MAGNVNTAPSKLSRLTTRFKALLIGQRQTLADPSNGGNPALVPLTIKLVSGQTANAIEVQNSAGTVLAGFTGAGLPLLPDSAIGLGLLRVAHAKYSFAVDGGLTGAITPVLTAVIPANAILLAGSVNILGAALSAGAATVSVGTTAGSSASSILAATAKASLTLAALINAVPVFATPVKMGAAGSINITVGTADLTAGIIEVFVLYVVATA